jgi:hypothetical protein
LGNGVSLPGMFNKIVIRNVGVLKAFDTPSAPKLTQLSLFYGRNGRGKSTLTAVMRAARDGCSSTVLARTSLGNGGAAPEVTLVDDSGNVRFKNGKWDRKDAPVVAAVAEAKASLSQRSGPGPEHSGMRPPKGWGHLAGEELVVRGSRGRRVQVARARLHQWTPRVEARFLALLAETCNLRLSLRAVGLSAASVHEHRKRWPDFDDRCEAMLARGYARIDTGLFHAACRLFSPDAYPEPETPAVAPVSADDAIRLVRLHERRRRDAALRIGPAGRVHMRRVWRWGMGRGR